MIDFNGVREIMAIYLKHGWTPGRVLLSAKLSSAFPESELQTLFGDCEISDSDIDAVWFFRKRADGDMAWEIRVLGANPFALCEAFPMEMSAEEIESRKDLLENRIRNSAS